MIYASVKLQGFIIRLIAWDRSIFRRNSASFVPKFR